MEGVVASDITPESVFPCVVPMSADLRSWEGPISCGPSAGGSDEGLWLRLSLDDVKPGSNTLAGAMLGFNQNLAVQLAGQESLVQQRLREAPSVAAFFVELRALLERQALNSWTHTSSQAAQEAITPSIAAEPHLFFDAILQSCDELGWPNIHCLAKDMRTLAMVITDSGGREHLINCRVPADYPKGAPIVEADLPLQLKIDWQPGQQSLVSIFKQHEAAVEGWQDLWGCLQDVDDNCWVLEPEHPRRSDLHRRLSLGRFCSIQVQLDTDHPWAAPAAQFMGAEATVGPLRRKWEVNLPLLWNTADLPRTNIARVLEMQLPSREIGNQEEISAACGICYSYFITDEKDGSRTAPDVNCSNPPCSRPYHRGCIVEWLRGVSDTRQSFDILFGQCVYCTQQISVKINPQGG